MPDFLRLAVGALTAIPVPPPRVIDRRVAGRAMACAPVALLPLGVLVGLLAWGAGELSLPPLVVGAALVTLIELANRAMHVDGLADTADGLSVAFDREKALTVMKRGDVGPSGAAAVALVLLLDAAAIAALLPRPGGWAVVACALVASRHALAWASRRGVPAARPDGLGQAMAGSVATWACLAAFVVVGACGAGVCWAAGAAWWVFPVALAGAVAVTMATVARVTARLGGITGDVLGFVIEASFTALLVLATIFSPTMA